MKPNALGRYVLTGPTRADPGTTSPDSYFLPPREAALARPARSNVASNLQNLSRPRWEQRIEQILKTKDPHHLGLVHVFSAMEPCSSYKPWHDKQTHKTFLKPSSGK